ncbi:hypothetical protein GSI_04941 [Ganoderma sinense ZZ0214-1]|uniref:Uncharacterized protein n=1 Tax=Ganoderma sinense ZZ0214-1 TaxID=1077348 RepID=A0A2G8SGC6_9APHY|nr:hypothetical protein GSI_04941 [Ganoderma sinense ZZ0214-1]
MLILFVEEYERIYYGRRVDRLHFIRQSIHALTHTTKECEHVGPGAYHTQWTMENAIGNFGKEIKLHSDPYANLSERGVRRAQVNALKAMLPDIDPDVRPLPRGAHDVGSGYILLRAMENTANPVRAREGGVLRKYLEDSGEELPADWIPRVARWARLRLPNGQIARSYWKESLKPISRIRIARNVKIVQQHIVQYAEVQYYMRLRIGEEIRALALVSYYSAPDQTLLDLSHGTIWSCTAGGDTDLGIVDVRKIESVVAMIPHPRPIVPRPGDLDLSGRYCVVEKPGLEVAYLGGIEEDVEEGDGEA